MKDFFHWQKRIFVEKKTKQNNNNFLNLLDFFNVNCHLLSGHVFAQFLKK